MLIGVKDSQSDLEKHYKTFCGLYRWTCFYVEIKSTYFTSSKMRYSASICGMDKKKNR